jgi:hypothetical protein
MNVAHNGPPASEKTMTNNNTTTSVRYRRFTRATLPIASGGVAMAAVVLRQPRTQNWLEAGTVINIRPATDTDAVMTTPRPVTTLWHRADRCREIAYQK